MVAVRKFFTVADSKTELHGYLLEFEIIEGNSLTLRKEKFPVMKKTQLSARIVLAMMLPALVCLMNSCGGSSTDIASLLGTVPSSSSTVIGLNLRSMLEKAGCNVDGSEVKISKELEEALSQATGDDSAKQKTAKELLSGDSGLDPSGAVVFIDAYNAYMTAGVYDTEKFTAFVEKESGAKFEDCGEGIRICRDTAIKGAQMWVCLGRNSIDPKAVGNYAYLSESQSFLTNPFAGEMAELKHDVSGWSTIRALTGKVNPLGGFSTFSIIQGMLFDGAESLAYSVDFEKGEMNAYARILNAEGETAKCLFPFSKIDTSLLGKLSGSAEAYAAVAVPEEMVKKIEKAASAFGGSFLDALMPALKSLDGTMAFAVGNLEDPQGAFSGVASTGGNVSPGLMDLLGNIGETRKDGKLVYFYNGDVKGGLEASKAADMLKGAAIGVVADAGSASYKNQMNGVKTLGITLNPDDGGLSLHVVAGSDNPKENFLLTALKNLK